jgi:5-methylcytosine-specific restriction endonuclease McrBC regulatory subunit McrC
MKTITINDNNNSGKELENDAVTLLSKIANKRIKDIQTEFPNLFIVKNNTLKDDLENNRICSLSGNQLGTGNIVGFLGIQEGDKSVQLHIHSRFDKSDEQYFLQYMLQKVFFPNVIDFKPSYDQESIYDFFLALLFPHYLKKALQQGLFKQYQQHHYNDFHVKGRIDIPSHLKRNLPFQGKVAYSCREFSYDNPVTQLIRHTLHYLKNKGWLFDKSADFLQSEQIIYSATPSWHIQDKAFVMQKNQNPIKHPFFTEYEPLRKICMRLLRQEGISLKGQDPQQQVYGVLFDAAWMWEEYLNTVLSKQGFEHPNNKKQTGKRYIFKGNQEVVIYPDFYSHDNRIVLDAKYKHIAEREKDFYQVITYIHVLNSQIGGLIYPLEKASQIIENTLNGYGGKVIQFGVKIPTQEKSYGDFKKEMEKSESEFKESIEKALNVMNK